MNAGDETVLLAAVDRARLAPSVHNTQPWAFRIVGGAVELWADPARRLTSIDPAGRELVLSCGLALLHLRVALEAAGRVVAVTMLPEPDRPDLLAVVQVTGTRSPMPASIALDAAADHRHTNRRAFSGALEPSMAEALETAASMEGAGLQPVTSTEDRTVAMVWQQEADHAQVRDPGYRAELRHWVGVERSADGVPLGSTAELDRATHDFATRDFAGAGTGGLVEGEDELGTAVFLLFTDGDAPADWLRAGQALGRVWLEGSRLGLVLQPLSQSVEDPVSRLHLRRDLRLLASWPQLLLRVGHAEAQPSTPRRSLADVVRR